MNRHLPEAGVFFVLLLFASADQEASLISYRLILLRQRMSAADHTVIALTAVAACTAADQLTVYFTDTEIITVAQKRKHIVQPVFCRKCRRYRTFRKKTGGDAYRVLPPGRTDALIHKRPVFMTGLLDSDRCCIKLPVSGLCSCAGR